jgi:hypothetical protein
MGTGRRVVLALALFVALCGVALVAFGGAVEPEEPSEREPARERLTHRALENAEEAERALMDRDYGRARERVTEVRRLLAELEGEE